MCFRQKGDITLKKSVLIIVSVLIVALIAAGVGIGIHFSKNKTPEYVEPEVLVVDFFEEFEPFECSGEYTSFGYISEVMNQDGMRFFSKGETEESEHHNVLVYEINGEEKKLYSVNDPEVDIDVAAYIDDALYFNISNSKEMGINGLYRVKLSYNEDGDIEGSSFTLRFNMNLEPMRAENNTLLLRKGDQYYLFDTQTGEYSEYN